MLTYAYSVVTYVLHHNTLYGTHDDHGRFIQYHNETFRFFLSLETIRLSSHF